MSGTELGPGRGRYSKLNEILERYSSVGPILVQAGRGWVNKPGTSTPSSPISPWRSTPR